MPRPPLSATAICASSLAPCAPPRRCNPPPPSAPPRRRRLHLLAAALRRRQLHLLAGAVHSAIRASPPPPSAAAPATATPARPRAYYRGFVMGEREFIDKDKLVLRGLQFHGFHGVKQEEKTLGQKFVVDVDAWMDLSAAGKTDSISDTVSYADIYRITKDVVEGPSHNLLESVAHWIARNTLLKFPQISAVRVKVGKPHVAVQGVVDYLGVEILRYRKDMGANSSGAPLS